MHGICPQLGRGRLRPAQVHVKQYLREPNVARQRPLLGRKQSFTAWPPMSAMGRKRTLASPRQRPQEIAFQNRISSVSVGQARVYRAGSFTLSILTGQLPARDRAWRYFFPLVPHTGHAWSSRNSLPLDRRPQQIGKMVAYPWPFATFVAFGRSLFLSPPCPCAPLRLCAPPSGGSGSRASRSIAYVCDRSDRSSPVQRMLRRHGVCVAARVSPKSAPASRPCWSG